MNDDAVFDKLVGNIIAGLIMMGVGVFIWLMGDGMSFALNIL